MLNAVTRGDDYRIYEIKMDEKLLQGRFKK
jgi:hypothetical protein